MSEIKFHKANALPSPISQAHDGVWLIADGANNYKHYIITGGVVKELIVDGEDLTLEQARQNGNVFEGNVVTELEVDDFLTKSLVSKEYVDDVTSGFITTESDPIFTASPAFGITNTDINNWNAKGVQLTADQPTAKIHLRDSAGNIISTLDVGFLNNEGTTISFNSTTDEIELRNDDDELLSSFPASALMTGVGYGLNLTGSTLELLDSANNAIDSVTLTISNIQGLQTALDGKALKTTQITAGTGLTGGGNLSSNITIGLSTSTQSDIAKGVTAYGWGNHADAGYLTTETDPTVPSHVKAITTADISNWDTAYAQRIQTFTTTGNSGAATFTGNTLNIPNYTLSGLGGVPLTRNITINGVTQDLSANRTWNISPDYSSLTNQRHIKKVGSNLADSNIQDTAVGSEVLGRLDSYATVERRTETSTSSLYTIDLSNPSGHYDLTLTDNTTIGFSNMVDFNQSTVITLVVWGDYSLLFPSWLKPMPSNDDYYSNSKSDVNLITILIRNGGGLPQGMYSLTNVDIS